jgi:hypothetical protein
MPNDDPARCGHSEGFRRIRHRIRKYFSTLIWDLSVGTD